jgi:methylated-DNA-[protein]-cysteine S-methyltransferase
MENMYTGVFESPVGRLYLARTGDALLRLEFGPQGIWSLLQSGAFMQAGEGMPPYWIEQLSRYFGGERTSFDIPLDLRGTPFEQGVWSALQTIAYGQTKTYSQIALQMERPRAARAVGRANGKNPVAIIVPCHRVVAAHSLGGYSAGLAVKQALLDIEAKGRQQYT